MKNTLRLIRNLTARTLVLGTAATSSLTLFTATPASANNNDKQYQLELSARPGGSGPLCLEVDITKVGVLNGAERVKVGPCRNIVEQKFRKVYADGTHFRLQTVGVAADGQQKCIDTNYTKVSVDPNAQWSKVGNCDNIREQLYWEFRQDHGNHNLKLVKVGPGTDTVAPWSQCFDVDGTMYGVKPEAALLKVKTCARINEQWWTLREIDPTPTPVPQGWRHLVLHSGQALNTNSGPLFSGSPWGEYVGLWSAVPEDPDQLFRFELQPNGLYMLRNQKLNKCLDSTNNHSNGSKDIMHPCNPNNPNQLWEAIPKGNNQFMLRRSSTNFCLSAPNDHSNGQHTWLWECVGNGNQVFASAYVAPTASPAPNNPPANSGSSQPKLIRSGGVDYVQVDGKEYFDLEVWLVARKREQGTWCSLQANNPGWRWNWEWELNCSTGHAFIGLVGRNRYTGGWEAVKTYSFWPNDDYNNAYQEVNSDLTINQPTDWKHLNYLLQGKKISTQGQAVRKARLGPRRAKWILDGAYREAGCIKYPTSSEFQGLYANTLGRISGESCHCMDYSTRFWHFITSEWEDFRVGLKNNQQVALTPNLLVDEMNIYTQFNGEFLDNGKRWQ